MYYVILCIASIYACHLMIMGHANLAGACKDAAQQDAATPLCVRQSD